ncbi:MAG: hypothetical protein AAF823_13095 [Planctomycetota bacterium]
MAAWSKIVIGVGLIVVGICLGIGVIQSLAGLFMSESVPPMVLAMTPDEAVQLGVDAVDVRLPIEFFTVFGYLVVCFLHAIAAGIGTAMISGGVRLFQPEIKIETPRK